jgi:negative regulator of flagellin synthesis FlgM
MKISSDHVGRILGAELRAKERTQAVDAAASRPDKVNLSRRAEDMKAVQRALDSTPEVREDKVAQLRQQIEEGSYRVDSEELAANIPLSAIIPDLSR